MVNNFFDRQLSGQSQIKFVQSSLKALKLKCYIGVLLLLLNGLQLEITPLIRHFRVNTKEYCPR